MMMNTIKDKRGWRQMEHTRGYMWHRCFITVNTSIFTVKLCNYDFYFAILTTIDKSKSTDVSIFFNPIKETRFGNNCFNRIIWILQLLQGVKLKIRSPEYSTFILLDNGRCVIVQLSCHTLFVKPIQSNLIYIVYMVWRRKLLNKLKFSIVT